MNSSMRCVIAFGAAALALVGSATSPLAQTEARSVWDGSYTEEQAGRGKVLYDSKCASCHGGSLAGIDIAPSLAGTNFMGNWSGQSAGDLADRIMMTMPADDPGSLGTGAVADVIAYMLKMNRAPPGGTELPASASQLRAIRIEPHG